MIWWEFIDGLYLSNGVDLVELFNEIDAIRTFNVIDAIIVEEMKRAGETENNIEKARTEILRVYNSTRENDNDLDDYGDVQGERSNPALPVKPYIPVIEPTEEGYSGLLPPAN